MINFHRETLFLDRENETFYREASNLHSFRLFLHRDTLIFHHEAQFFEKYDQNPPGTTKNPLIKPLLPRRKIANCGSSTLHQTTTMPDATPPPATPETAAPRTRGYFNQAQLEDLELADIVIAAALDHPEEMTEQDITADYLAGFQAALEESRARSAAASHEGDESKQATQATAEAAKALITALQKIQSSAKQKHKMLDEDGDPSTNFPVDGYLIGTRLDANRAALLQSAATLIARASADSLPGFKTPAKIAAVKSLLTAYTGEKEDQAGAQREKELSRLDRDGLLHLINTRRSAVQHAADAIWPASQEATRPIRKTFKIPLTRAMGL